MNARLRQLLDAHFGATITRADERELRAMLDASTEARQLYARRLAASKLDPAAPTAEQRLARGLGLPAAAPSGASSRVRKFALPAAAALAAAAAFPMMMQKRAVDDGFAARGTGLAPAPNCALHIYKSSKHGQPEPVTTSIQSNDELLFSYDNGCEKKQLMIYAVDEQKNVYWFHPGWTDAAQNPSSVPLSKEPGVHELRVAVAHAWRGKRIDVHGTFLSSPWHVKEAEAAMHEGRFAPPDAVDIGRHIEVRP